MTTNEFIGEDPQRSLLKESNRANPFRAGQIYLFAILFLSLILTSCSEEKHPEGEGRDTTASEGKPETSPTGQDSSAEPASKEINPDRLIVPGERIGQTRIGESLDSVNARLGDPDSGDAGMGHVWQFRYSPARNGEKPHELDIYGSFDNEATGHYVRQIRITSPWFTTREHISTGSPFDSILHAFPDIRPTAEFQDEKGKDTYLVYDDPKKGIGFEFARDAGGKPTRCTAIIVDERGRNAAQLYIPRHAFREIGSK